MTIIAKTNILTEKVDLMQNKPHYHRVTEVLKRFAEYDCIPEFILDKAANRGDRIHAYCEKYVRGNDLSEIDPDCYPYVRAFCDWFDDAVEEVLFCERRLYSKMSNFTGRIDLVVKLYGDESYTVVDIKTTVDTHRTWHLQTAAYRLLCLENHFEVDRRLILQLKKIGSYTVHEHKQYIRDTELFLNALSLHNFFSCSNIIS
jgi:hypothetical protein